MIDKFTLNAKKLQMIFNNQKVVFDKAWIGFKTQKKQKFLKNFFVKESSLISQNVIYFCYDKTRHKSYVCNFRKVKDSQNIKKVWILKGTMATNPKEPKMIWVPKTTT